MREHAGIAVGLQLHLHLNGVRFRASYARLHAANLIGNTGDGLHMMSHLVRDDIGGGEVARAAICAS